MNDISKPKNLFETDKGLAHIKSEYLIHDVIPERASASEEKSGNEANSQNSLQDKRKKSHTRGQNKKRGPTFIQGNEFKLCSSLIDVDESVLEMPVCTFTNCKFIHDVKEYMENKPPDLGDVCYVYSVKGHCSWGAACRYAKNHLTENFRNKKDIVKMENRNEQFSCSNILTKELMVKLRKKDYDFNLSNSTIENYDKCKQIYQANNDNVKSDYSPIDCIPLKQNEKKRIDWKNKLFLAPLTTVGNLPFRRICKEYGVDVTCSEMTVSTSLLAGVKQEWALCKRHYTEDLFGIQICGKNPYTLTKCVQLLQEQTDADFIDINLGCPIDAIYKSGAGSGLLIRRNVLYSCLHNMSSVSAVPLTVKCRTGVYSDEKMAHKVLPIFEKCDVSVITIHGRTREQMYTKQADWPYIEECAQSMKDIPLFGNGDILSFTDYNFVKENCPNVAGVMIARGALYKPWIFTEIKEQRHWDISSRERMDILKRYVNYGLEHWGSDTKGVENVRRFLLEWLSFLYRYIPVGLLEYPPQHINQRPPAYKGRDELETLMASGNCKDWIRISEMLLGPVPSNFTFVPKHKANALQG